MNPAESQQLQEARRAVRQARAQGRRWYLRAVLMLCIAAVALHRGGQINTFIGVAMLVVALLAASLGHTTRRQATAMQQKLDLMAGATALPEDLGG
jgi:hypothetical protein